MHQEKSLCLWLWEDEDGLLVCQLGLLEDNGGRVQGGLDMVNILVILFFYISFCFCLWPEDRVSVGE